jgi:hypothetical protein
MFLFSDKESKGRRSVAVTRSTSPEGQSCFFPFFFRSEQYPDIEREPLKASFEHELVGPDEVLMERRDDFCLDTKS